VGAFFPVKTIRSAHPFMIRKLLKVIWKLDAIGKALAWLLFKMNGSHIGFNHLAL